MTASASDPRPDITTREDCEHLVRAFYTEALVDPLIGYLFTDVAHLDLVEHIPRITDFWETVLLGAGSYSGGAFRPHADLHAKSPLLSGHFDRWVALWHATVDARHAGPRAEMAKAHAVRVARAFRSRLEGRPQTIVPDVAPGVLLSVTRHGGASSHDD